MTTDIRVFNAYEWTKNRDDYNNFVNSVSKRVKNQVIAFYFDEDEDNWEVFRARPDGSHDAFSFYSWDELSQFIHDNI